MKTTKGLVAFDFDDTLFDGCLEYYLFTCIPQDQHAGLFDRVRQKTCSWPTIISELIPKTTKDMSREKAIEYNRDRKMNDGMEDLLKFLY